MRITATRASTTARRAFVGLAFVIGFALATSAALAQADPDEDAKAKASERFLKGVELYKSGDVRAALIEFRRAYTLAPTYQLLFNIGQAAAELRDYTQAYESFTRYLADGGDAIGGARREMVEREIARLRSYLARLTLEVEVEDAEVSVDGVVVGRTPLRDPILLSAGRRSIVVQREGYARWERLIDLAGEDSERIKVELISLAPEPPPRQTPPEPRDSDAGMGAGFWTSAALTTAFAVGTGVTFALTLQAKGDYDDELAQVPTTQAAIDDAADKVDRLALVTDVGLALTAAGAITTIVFAIRGNSQPRRSESVGLIVSPRGVGVAGRF